MKEAEKQAHTALAVIQESLRRCELNDCANCYYRGKTCYEILRMADATISALIQCLQDVRGRDTKDKAEIAAPSAYWKQDGTCSHCGKQATYTETAVYFEVGAGSEGAVIDSFGALIPTANRREYRLTEHCPNCGKKMKNGRKNE